MMDLFNMFARGVKRAMSFTKLDDPLEKGMEFVSMGVDSLVAVTKIIDKFRSPSPA